MPSLPNRLLEHPNLWRGDECARVAAALPSGFAALDEHLPGGGWPQAALTELMVQTAGIGELTLLMPACARLTHAGRRVVFVSPPYVPYAPALADAGLDLGRLLLVEVESHKDRLWALQQCLESRHCGAVLAWLGGIDMRELRRLQLACERGLGSAFLFLPQSAALNASPAALRLALAAATDRLSVRILKRRGGSVAHPILIDAHAHR